MSKRPALDLMALTSGHAAPMPEATQRTPSHAPEKNKPRTEKDAGTLKTEDLKGLSFKVSPAFRKRFRQRAATAELKLNELLFEALDAWEAKHGIKS